MVPPFSSRLFHYPLWIVVSLVLFFWNLGGSSLWDVDEGRNATAALEMMESENWVTPSFNGKLRVDKPVLIYWLQVASYRAFGVNEFAARFPSALAALLSVIVAYELGRRMFSLFTGLLGAFVLATTPMLCGAARFANPDSLLNLFSLMILALFWQAFPHLSLGSLLAIGASTGLAVLAKGPIGFVLPGAIVFLFLAWEKRWDLVFSFRWAWSFLACFLVAGPWYIWVGAETKMAFLKDFFFIHHWNRFLSPLQDHPGFPGFYLMIIFLGIGPWAIFFTGLFWTGFWSAIRKPHPRVQFWWEWSADQGKDVHRDLTPAYRFLLIWIFAYLVFFSISATKLPNYILPVVAPTSLLLARFLDRWRLEKVNWPVWYSRSAHFFMVVPGVVLGGAWLTHEAGFWSLPRLVPSGVGGLLFVGFFLSAGGICWIRLKSNRTLAISVFAGWMFLFIAPLSAFLGSIFNEKKAVLPLVENANVLQKENDIRIAGWGVANLASINFYAQRDVMHLPSFEEIASLTDYPIPVYLFLPENEWKKLEAQYPNQWDRLHSHFDMYLNRKIVVASNRIPLPQNETTSFNFP